MLAVRSLLLLLAVLLSIVVIIGVALLLVGGVVVGIIGGGRAKGALGGGLGRGSRGEAVEGRLGNGRSLLAKWVDGLLGRGILGVTAVLLARDDRLSG